VANPVAEAVTGVFLVTELALSNSEGSRDDPLVFPPGATTVVGSEIGVVDA
jgi:hypothetical protein